MGRGSCVLGRRFLALGMWLQCIVGGIWRCGLGCFLLGVWFYCGGGVALMHWGRGLAMEAWLLCIGVQLCGSRGVAKMHCGRGLAMEVWLSVLWAWLCHGAWH